MKVLVTGGAGYIGSVVGERLLEAGHVVVVYDNLSEGHRSAVPPGAPLVVGDLADRNGLVECISRHDIDAVVHMAAYALVGESVQDPARYYHNNLVGGLNLLDAMRQRGVDRVVFSSTCAVYGEPERVPITEDLPRRPSNPYGETKLALERALQWYERAYGIRYASMRYFNAAGATARLGEDHDPETHLIPIVLECALGQRDEVVIYGDDYATRDGTCVRDYIHVEDLADAHILALESLARGSSVYNLGSGDGYSVLEVIETARRITGCEIPARVGPRRPGDPAMLVAGSELITRELGWSPRHPGLDPIIDSAWKWKQLHPNGYS